MVRPHLLLKFKARSILFILPFILLTANSACTGTTTILEDQPEFQNALKTAVAGTVTAQALNAQRTKGAEAALSPTETSSPTNTVPPSPTSTPEPTKTPMATTQDEDPTATQGTITVPLSGPAVQVSVDTNCRSGPGKSYTYLGALMVGEEAVILGKDPSGAYWYITNPDQEESYCWIWGYYATVSGNTAPLPVYTPGPTPTPEANFSTDVHQVETCGGAWQVEFTVVNNGSITLESISTTIKDTVTGKSTGKSTDNFFIEKNGCAVLSSMDRVKPDGTVYTVSLDLPDDPTGHLIYVKMKVCDYDNLAGNCRTREYYFTP